MMGRRWWQNQMAESRLTLPVSVVTFLVVRALEGMTDSLTAVGGALLCLATAAVMLETNVGLQLLRVRSRLGESLWLLMAAAMPWLYPLDSAAVCAFCLACALGLLLCCYQSRTAVTWVFHCFLFLGVGCLFAPVMLPLSLMFYLCLALFMRAFSWKAFWAGVVGLFTPCWCWTLWEACMGDVTRVPARLTELWLAAVPQDGLSLLPDGRLLPVWGMLVLASVVGFVHYMRKRYDDKIRTRMMCYVYVYVTLFLHAAFLLLPSSRTEVLAMLAVSCSPLLAHYWAMVGGRVGQVMLLLCLAVWAGVLAVSFLAV